MRGELSPKVVASLPCDQCGSSDNRRVFDDGHEKCFTPGCKHFVPPGGAASEAGIAGAQRLGGKLIKYEPCDLPERKLREDTLRKFRYGIGEYQGKRCHVACYCDDGGRVTAQKLRFKDKTFKVLGAGKDMPFCGQWLWNGGPNVVITEGEIDMLSMAQAQDNRWPVVSLPNGAQSAASVVKAQLEWLDKFDRIILCFDMDKAGRAAVEACAPLLPLGKGAVMNLPEKDANAVLIKHGPARLLDAMWKAKDWRPDGIISGAEITVARMKAATAIGLPWPDWLPKLQAMTLGIRPGELTLLTAGTGIGKSTFAREIAYYLHMQHGKRIGNVFLEESNDKTGQAYVAIHHSVPLGRLRADSALLSDVQWDEGQARVVAGMWFYNHFGSLESANLLRKLRFFRTALGVDFIVLDHISIVISGTESSSEGERRDIDMLMTRLRSLVEETGVGIIAVVHLSQPKGAAHEEGAQVSLNQLRGSGSLKHLSDNVIAFERDQQGDNQTLMQVRLLKCREVGELGLADTINYDRETGRLVLAPEFEPMET